jgi:hypothetical protein
VIPTLFGLLTLALGAWLLRRNDPLVITCWMLILGLFNASAAAIGGGSSIPPARFFLFILVFSVFLNVRDRASVVSEAAIANAPLLFFCAYGFIGAFILPKIFAGQIDVVPMRASYLRSIFDAYPLFFSTQNITTAIYLMGTGLTAVATYTAARLSDDVTPLIKAGAAIALVHAFTGILGVVLAGTPWDSFVDFLRNGTYAQLRQQQGSIVRMSGITPEPSVFAAFGMVWMIFSLELWLRGVRPRLTGFAAMVLAAVLLASTSSTAYVAMAGYMAILAMRFLMFPKYLRGDKVLIMALSVMVIAVIVIAVVVFAEGFAKQASDILDVMVWNKSTSNSGQQRQFWAMQGLDAFGVSMGLGIGPGSFRSSSLATAIIGSMGVIGVVTFVWYCLTLVMPRRRARDGKVDPTRVAVAGAATWAALAGLIPALISGASPDPGMEFAALAGLALALQRPALAKAGAAAAARKGEGWGQLPMPSSAAALPPARAPEAPQPAGWRRSAR